jgi:hypothetical protein
MGRSPKHDRDRDRFLNWGAAAEQKLINEAADKGVWLEIRVHDQFFYNFGNLWQTNLPWSGNDVTGRFQRRVLLQ